MGEILTPTEDGPRLRPLLEDLLRVLVRDAPSVAGLVGDLLGDTVVLIAVPGEAMELAATRHGRLVVRSPSGECDVEVRTGISTIARCLSGDEPWTEVLRSEPSGLQGELRTLLRLEAALALVMRASARTPAVAARVRRMGAMAGL